MTGDTEATVEVSGTVMVGGSTESYSHVDVYDYAIDETLRLVNGDIEIVSFSMEMSDDYDPNGREVIYLWEVNARVE